jgi:hypothetical protein
MLRAGKAKAAAKSKTKKTTKPTKINAAGVKISDVSSFFTSFEEGSVPLDITPADVRRWTANNSKCPDDIPDILFDLMCTKGKDMIHAGTWLAEQLCELGISLDIIHSVQFNIGRMGPRAQWPSVVKALAEFKAKQPRVGSAGAAK